jgi:hypothetical protein
MKFYNMGYEVKLTQCWEEQLLEFQLGDDEAYMKEGEMWRDDERKGNKKNFWTLCPYWKHAVA